MKWLLFSSWLVLLQPLLGQLSSPVSPLNQYYHAGKNFSRHHEVVSFFQSLQSLYPTHVKMETYGTTPEGRPLFLVFLSSEKNISQLSSIRVKHLELDPNETIPIVWFSYNVHGNESSGTEAAMETAYRLVTDKKKLLDECLVIIDPCLNPDGRDRYVNFFRQYQNPTFPEANASIEHHEPWPSGRFNHYLFDLNRDWAWATQKESKQRIPVYQQWLPHVHVDFHEQSYNEPYYFPPAAEPYHEQITPWQRTFQKDIGKNHANIFDKNHWLYFSKEVFDLLYPSYGDTYPMFHGSIGMTYEQGGSGRAGLSVITDKQDTLTLTDRIFHHVTTGFSTIETVLEHQHKLIKAFHEFYNETAKNPYTLILDGDAPNIDRLLALLNTHQIQYKQPSNNTPNAVEGLDYFSQQKRSYKIKPNDILVTSNQPQRTLMTVLFEPQTFLSDSITYDITAWSLPYAYGVPCMKIDKLIPCTIYEKKNPKNSPLTLSDEPYAVAIEWRTLTDAKYLNQLLKQGFCVSVTDIDIETKEGKLNRGTLLLLKANNKDKSLQSLVNNELVKMDLKYKALRSGWNNTIDLGTSHIKTIKNPRIAVPFNDKTSPTSLGEIWYFLSEDLEIPHQRLLWDADETPNLNDIDILLIPEDFTISNMESLKAWIEQGGTCIVMGTAHTSFTEAYFGLSNKPQEPTKDTEEVKMENRERMAMKETVNGAIYACTPDPSHPLAYGYDNTYFTLRLNASTTIFDGDVAQKIKENKGWMSGFAGASVKYEQLGSVSSGSKPLGDGHIVFFFDNPLFRGFWENGKLQLANAFYFLD
ncbi:MAG: M14 family zinc carboxypeptidase [Flavobacteriales bacterium]